MAQMVDPLGIYFKKQLKKKLIKLFYLVRSKGYFSTASSATTYRTIIAQMTDAVGKFRF